MPKVKDTDSTPANDAGQSNGRSSGQAQDEPEAQPQAEQKLFPTSVVGSYSVPEWLERVKTDYYQRRISRTSLNGDP